MSYSKLFSKVPIEVPNRSGFDESHSNFFTSSLGTLTPCFCDFLIPDDEVDLGASMQVQLPPMATDFYGRIDAKCEAFFVPCRILFGGWKDFITYPFEGRKGPTVTAGQQAKYLIGAQSYGGALQSNVIEGPAVEGSSTTYGSDFYDQLEQIFSLSATEMFSTLFTSIGSSTINLNPGSLADFLGFKSRNSESSFPNKFLQLVLELNSLSSGNGIDALHDGEHLTLWPYDFANSLQVLFDSAIGTTLAFTVVLDTEDEFGQQVFEPLADFVFTRLVNVATSSNYIQMVVNLSDSNIGTNLLINNILPFVAYHKIYDDWYRDSIIQQPLFERQVANNSVGTTVANMPWITSGLGNKTYFSGDQLKFANGHNLFDLHQRNWQKDYLISATPEPQAGDASKVSFEITDNSGEFTIASLRAANALQQWLDRNNLAGYRYGEQIYAQYGVYPSDAITDRAIYLGQMNVNVYNKSVYQQTLGTSNDLETNNPFNAIGAKYSNPQGVSQGGFCNNYRVTEHGFLMVIFSLVPQAYYSTGVKRMFNYSDISDIAFPLLAGVGDQEIYGREIVDNYGGTGNETVFGYTQRYAEYKFMDDEVHGLLRDGESLSAFALQRSFNEVPQLGSEFLQIPKDYLDQVSATNYKISEFGCWVDSYFNYKKSSKLPAYSIPTLGEMKNTHTEIIDKGGKRL